VRILLADDEPGLRVTLGDDLREEGHDVTVVADGAAALAALEAGAFDCVLTDLRMPGADGLAVLDAAVRSGADAVVITGVGSVGSAVEAMKRGAYDYLEKPFLNEEVLLVLGRIEERRALRNEVAELRSALRGRSGFGGLVGASAPMQEVAALARSAAATDATVLLVGESGTGKEVLARAIHEESARSGPFVPIPCAAFSDTLLEDELFGHEKGAFTDARTARPGRFERAGGGTVLLDDIDDVRPATQVKLLRVLQERTVERLGGTKPVPVDIRVLAASKVDLWGRVREGGFREDLYHRLNVVRIDLPPLRSRPEDIPLLVAHFLEKHARGVPVEVRPETMEALLRSGWPGNVRQLENAVQRALALRGGAATLRPEHLLPRESGGGGEDGEADGGAAGDLSLAAAVARAERIQIERALRATGANRTRAAELLGISRKNLWEKMKSLGVRAPE
jgi:DNA-binding NtrC family response regulator